MWHYNLGRKQAAFTYKWAKDGIPAGLLGILLSHQNPKAYFLDADDLVDQSR
jgi:hypothetical protein